MRFYPGNRVELGVRFAGILLSVALIFCCLFATGFRTVVSIVIGASAGLLWLLASAVSSAV
jgi:hypothetical protein